MTTEGTKVVPIEQDVTETDLDTPNGRGSRKGAALAASMKSGVNMGMGGMKAGLGMGTGLAKGGMNMGVGGMKAGMNMGVGSMKAGLNVSKAVLPSQVPDGPEAVDEMLDAFDLNGDNMFSREEVRSMAMFMIQEKKKVQSAKFIVWIVIALCIAGGFALFGICIGANEASKDAKPNSDGVLKDVSTGTAVATDSVKSYASILDFPRLPSESARACSHVTLSVVDAGEPVTLFHKLAGFKKYSSNKMDLVTDEAGTVIRIDLDQEPSKQVAVMVKEGTQMRATHCAGSAGCIMYGSATSATNRRRLNEVGRVPETFSWNQIMAMHSRNAEASRKGRRILNDMESPESINDKAENLVEFQTSATCEDPSLECAEPIPKYEGESRVTLQMVLAGPCFNDVRSNRGKGLLKKFLAMVLQNQGADNIKADQIFVPEITEADTSEEPSTPDTLYSEKTASKRRILTLSKLQQHQFATHINLGHTRRLYEDPKCPPVVISYFAEMASESQAKTVEDNMNAIDMNSLQDTFVTVIDQEEPGLLKEAVQLFATVDAHKAPEEVEMTETLTNFDLEKFKGDEKAKQQVLESLKKSAAKAANVDPSKVHIDSIEAEHGFTTDSAECHTDGISTCFKSMIGDGVCQDICDNASCHFDAGDCKVAEGAPEGTKPGECAPGCANFLVGDGLCNPKCDVASCNFDDGDCAAGSGSAPRPGSSTAILANALKKNKDIFGGGAVGWRNEGDSDNGNTQLGTYDKSAGSGFTADQSPSSTSDRHDPFSACPVSCDRSFISDGMCDEICNIEPCQFDGGDCNSDLYCDDKDLCLWSDVGNGVCDPHCLNDANCFADDGDCAESKTQHSYAGGSYQINRHLEAISGSYVDAPSSAAKDKFEEEKARRAKKANAEEKANAEAQKRAQEKQAQQDENDKEKEGMFTAWLDRDAEDKDGQVGRYKDVCHGGCLDTMRGDSICQKECNNLECFFDDGDCLSPSQLSELQTSTDMSMKWMEYQISKKSKLKTVEFEESKRNGGVAATMCAPGCTLAMIGDGHCDPACISDRCELNRGGQKYTEELTDCKHEARKNTVQVHISIDAGKETEEALKKMNAGEMQTTLMETTKEVVDGDHGHAAPKRGLASGMNSVVDYGSSTRAFADWAADGNNDHFDSTTMGMSHDDMGYHVESIHADFHYTQTMEIDIGDNDPTSTVKPTPFPTMATPPPVPAPAMSGSGMGSTGDDGGTTGGTTTPTFEPLSFMEEALTGDNTDSASKPFQRSESTKKELKDHEATLEHALENAELNRDVILERIKEKDNKQFTKKLAKLSSSIQAIKEEQAAIADEPKNAKKKLDEVAELCTNHRKWATETQNRVGDEFAAMCYVNGDAAHGAEEMLEATKECGSDKFKEKLAEAKQQIDSDNMSPTWLLEQLEENIRHMKQIRDAHSTLHSCGEGAFDGEIGSYSEGSYV